MGAAALRQFLESLCSNTHWSYAVLWKLRHGNPMFLTWEDGYLLDSKPRETVDCVSHGINNTRDTCTSSSGSGGYSAGLAVAEMSSLQYSLGERAVGKIALTGDHLWFKFGNIFTDELSTSLLPECPEEWLLQLASGIKTILLVPVLPHGVLQLGSLEVVTEDIDFVNNVKNKSDALLCGRSSTMLCNLYPGRSFQTGVVLSPTSSLKEYVKGSPVDATGHVKFEGQGDSVVVSHKDNKFHLGPILFPFADPSPYVPVEKGPLVASPDKNNIKNEVSGDGVIQVATSSNYGDITELETMESKLSELSYLLEELQAYPGCSALDSGIFGEFSRENISTYVTGNMTCQVSTIKFGDGIDQDMVDGFLNFPADCELHEALGPVLADHTHEEFFNTSLWIDNFPAGSSFACHEIPFDSNALPGQVEGSNGEILLDAVVTDSHSYLDDGLDFSSGFNQSTNSSQTQDPFKSGLSGVSDSLLVACDRPASDSEYGHVATTAAALKSMMESVLSGDQDKRLYNNMQGQRGQKASSASKRRGKPGCNPKPRPRDRQRIQDSLKELRKLVPNGEKCSIDGLLDKTAKHMMYLRSVTDQAQLLKQLVNKGLQFKQRKTGTPSESKGSAQHGTSWEFELFNEQNECPIHVEDGLAHPGQLVIEVLCNERVLFLEIAHVIRGLELNILKGFMQIREENTWARFLVEASEGFQRLDIFWPLMQLLQRKRNPIDLNNAGCLVSPATQVY